MKQSDIKKLQGKTFVWDKTYSGNIWSRDRITIGIKDDEFRFFVRTGSFNTQSLTDLARYVADFEGKVSSKDFVDILSGKTMYDILKEPETTREFQVKPINYNYIIDNSNLPKDMKLECKIKPINYNYISNVDLPKDIRRDCSTVVAMANDKEPKNDKIFLHSCHHLSSELKEVAVYMIKFMRLCKKCSQNTFYTVMRDKFPKLYYEERNIVAYRMLQDKVITAIEDMYATRHYLYTPEEVNK